MPNKIDKRDDTKPKYGTRKYGNVAFADTVNNKYPIDTEEHVRAAWAYINQPKNAAEYTPEDAELIRKHIKAAAKKFGIKIDPKA